MTCHPLSGAPPRTRVWNAVSLSSVHQRRRGRAGPAGRDARAQPGSLDEVHVVDPDVSHEGRGIPRGRVPLGLPVDAVHLGGATVPLGSPRTESMEMPPPAGTPPSPVSSATVNCCQLVCELEKRRRSCCSTSKYSPPPFIPGRAGRYPYRGTNLLQRPLIRVRRRRHPPERDGLVAADIERDGVSGCALTASPGQPASTSGTLRQLEADAASVVKAVEHTELTSRVCARFAVQLVATTGAR